jgi:effector-binding domain-containing protein
MTGTHAYRLEVQDVPGCVVGSIRGRVAVAGLDPWIAEAIQELFLSFGQQGVQPTGPPFAMLPAPNGSEEVDVEVALPASRDVLDRGRMSGRRIPPCRALTTVHPGAYEELTSAYETLALAMKDQGIEPSSEPREVYVTNPLVTPTDELITEVLWPIDVPPDWVLSAPTVERPLPRARS